MSDNILIIDGMNMAYRAYYAYSKLSYKGRSTSMIFGIPSIIRPLINQYKPSRIYVVWDGDKHPKRLKLCPEYKQRDHGDRTEFFKEIERVKRLLYYLGITQVHNEKVEGDDMIYLLLKSLPKDTKKLIVSGDKDFEQLIAKDVDVLVPNARGSSYPSVLCLFTYAINRKGLQPNQSVDYLCLTGDNSDNIKGYHGIGEVKAAQFLDKHKSIQAFLNNAKAQFNGIDRDKLQKVYKVNKLMIDLPYFNDRYNKKKKIRYYRSRQFPVFNEEKFKAMCLKYNLKTFLTKNFQDLFR